MMARALDWLAENLYWPRVWAALFLFGLVLEGIALWSPGKHDTLSEQVWALLNTLPGRLILWPLWVWLTWHFFLERAWFFNLHRTEFMDDIVVSGTMVVVVVLDQARRMMVGG